MEMFIECAGWRQSSCDDGPGIRSVLFLQGCSMNCLGCHNKELQKRGSGKLVTIESVVHWIVSKCHNKKITISGGEPMEQVDALKQLLFLLKQQKFNICLYTGWNKSMIPTEVLQQVDYIKTGSFIEERKNENINYVGSDNQRMYYNDGKGSFKELNLLTV